LVVGPEGGVSPEELELFAGAGARVCRLGRRVLRTSTAGTAAAALLLGRTGRWGWRGPAGRVAVAGSGPPPRLPDGPAPGSRRPAPRTGGSVCGSRRPAPRTGGSVCVSRRPAPRTGVRLAGRVALRPTPGRFGFAERATSARHGRVRARGSRRPAPGSGGFGSRNAPSPPGTGGFGHGDRAALRPAQEGSARATRRLRPAPEGSGSAPAR